MKKNKLIMIGVSILILICAQVAAFGADKTFFIKGTNIKSLGTNVDAGNDEIIFVKGSASLTLYIPGTTTPITDFRIVGGVVDTKGSPRGRNVQVDCVIGDVLGATVWYPAVGAGNFYRRTSLTMSRPNFEDSALTWDWTNLAVDYKAEAPYKPTISKFAESTTSYTDGRPSTSALTVYSEAGSGTTGLREITSYAWKMWPATESEPTTTVSGATGVNLSLDSSDITAGVTYRFKVKHANAWGETWSDSYDYEVAGGGMGVGPETVTITFRTTDDLGINPFSFPFANLTDPAGVTNLKQLIEAVNTEAGENVVTVAGWWNKEAQEPWGYIITYNSSALNDFGTFTTAGEVPSNPADVALEKDMAYQFSVLRPVSIDATGTR